MTEGNNRNSSAAGAAPLESNSSAPTATAAEPAYYGRDGMVWKSPVKKLKPGGGMSISLGFPVCTMHEAAEGQEEVLAAMLCRSVLLDELADAIRDALADGALEKAAASLRATDPAHWVAQDKIQSLRAALTKATA